MVRKLRGNWEGPYQVVEVILVGAYIIKDVGGLLEEII